MSEIQWRLPGIDEPGYLRRRRELSKLLDANPSPKNTEALIEFLLPFVDELEGDEAREALLDASQAEYGKAVLSMMGYSFDIPDPKGERSGRR